MATVDKAIRKRKSVMQFLFGEDLKIWTETEHMIRDVGIRSYYIIWICVLGALVTSFAVVLSYLAYSGLALRWLVLVMAGACIQLGNCANLPAMLSGVTMGVMLLAIFTLVILTALRGLNEETEPDQPNYDQMSLLINWYRISPREREWLIDMLHRSDAVDSDEAALNMLRNEHRELQLQEKAAKITLGG